MLTVLDEYTRQAPCVDVREKMTANDVLTVMHRLILPHGKPEYIRSDNHCLAGDFAKPNLPRRGPEFIANALQGWLKRVGVKPIQIYPGSPWENGYNERFNGTLRREGLNSEWFHSLKQAQVAINAWLREYNHNRPHHALDMRPSSRNLSREIQN